MTPTGASKGGPAHGTRIQPGQCLLFRQMGHLAWDCPNRGTRDDSGINLKRAFGSFVEMTGDRCFFASSHDDFTAINRAIFRFQHVLRTRCNLDESFWSLWNSSCPFWCHQPALSSAKHGCSVGTQTEPELIPPPSSTQQRSTRTVLITEKGIP